MRGPHPCTGLLSTEASRRRRQAPRVWQIVGKTRDPPAGRQHLLPLAGPPWPAGPRTPSAGSLRSTVPTHERPSGSRRRHGPEANRRLFAENPSLRDTLLPQRCFRICPECPHVQTAAPRSPIGADVLPDPHAAGAPPTRPLGPGSSRQTSCSGASGLLQHITVLRLQEGTCQRHRRAGHFLPSRGNILAQQSPR